MIWPAQALRSQGYDVNLIPPQAQGSGFLAITEKNEQGIEYLKSIQVPDDAEVLVIQRPAHPLQPQMINILRSNGIAVVVDMDDDMSSIHPDNVAFHIYRHNSGSNFSWKYAELSCKLATFVTTSTPQLQKVYAKHGRGMVIDNYVPASYLNYPKYQTYSFGWAGTTKSHPNDPQVIGPAVRRLIEEGYSFQVVGGDPGIKQAFRLTDSPVSTGTLSIADWAPTIGTTMDVGLAPLATSTFNTSKSRLKAIEYMATGVAWVGSPRAEYRRTFKESGCGLLAETPKQWHDYTKKLLDDASLWAEQSEAGRAYMKDQTYEAQAWRWMEAWELAYKIEKERIAKIESSLI